MASFFFLNFSLGRFKTDSIIKSLRKRSQILPNVKLGYNNKALLLTDAVTNAKTTLMMGRTLAPPRESISRVPYEVCGQQAEAPLGQDEALPSHCAYFKRGCHHQHFRTRASEKGFICRESKITAQAPPAQLSSSWAIYRSFNPLQHKNLHWFLSLAITLISPTSTNLESHFNFQSFH